MDMYSQAKSMTPAHNNCVAAAAQVQSLLEPTLVMPAVRVVAAVVSIATVQRCLAAIVVLHACGIHVYAWFS